MLRRVRTRRRRRSGRRLHARASVAAARSCRGRGSHSVASPSAMPRAQRPCRPAAVRRMARRRRRRRHSPTTARARRTSPVAAGRTAMRGRHWIAGVGGALTGSPRDAREGRGGRTMQAEANDADPMLARPKRNDDADLAARPQHGYAHPPRSACASWAAPITTRDVRPASSARVRRTLPLPTRHASRINDFAAPVER